MDERRKAERRAMPREVHELVKELRAISRAPGAQTQDGTEWRTIPKATIDALMDVLVRSWRSEDV